ncbi:MAG: hypothetical protein DRI95_09260 [Bacteroidetes bacterium]|nr:MAG: hypothetical protein DRI95_09260 [Bacteroidota bacterium]
MAKKIIPKQIVCDSNVFINLLRNDKKTIAVVAEIGENNIIMPVITAIELVKGTENKNELKYIVDFIMSFHSLQLNNKGINLSLEFVKKYHLAYNLGLADAMIAASVVTANLQLFTFNVKDFNFIKGLKLYYSPSISNIKKK